MSSDESSDSGAQAGVGRNLPKPPKPPAVKETKKDDSEWDWSPDDETKEKYPPAHFRPADKPDHADVLNLVEIIKNNKHKMAKHPDIALVCQNWSFPEGKKQPAVVLAINPYVECGLSCAFIPGEIAMCSFTIKKGLDPTHYWTLVDLANNVPKGENVAVFKGIEKYGLPRLPFSPFFQDYERIVGEIEEFLEKAGGDPTPEHGYLIFCPKEYVGKYTTGLKWLYEQAGEEFRHRVVPLENLLVCLSMGGLECLVKRKSSEMEFPEALDIYCKIVRAAEENTSKTGTADLTEEQERAISGSLGNFMSTVYRTFGSYTYIGDTSRIATTKLNFPAAVLGAFIFEEQVTKYFNSMQYLWMSSLSCEFHRENTNDMPAYLAKIVRRISKKDQPANQQHRCALTAARSTIFITLDALLINYGIRAEEGRHYPMTEKIPPPESFQLEENVNVEPVRQRERGNESRGRGNESRGRGSGSRGRNSSGFSKPRQW